MRFTVVIPCWNRARELERLLASLAAQQGAPRFEVIVADDGSTDDTPAAVERFQPWLDVRRVAQENRGPAAARNLGARAAHGEILAFIDSDAYAAPGWLAALDAAATAHPASGLFYGPVRADAPMAPPFVHSIPTEDEHVPGANLAVRAQTFRALGGFDERLRYAEDNDFSERARLAGLEIVFVPEAVVHHPASIRRWSLAHAGRPPAVWAMIRYLYRKHPHKKAFEASASRLALRAAIKLVLLAGLPALAWPWLGPLGLPLGWLALAANGGRNVLRAARAAAQARPPLRLVPSDCAVYVTLGWLNDFIELASWFRSRSLDAEYAAPSGLAEGAR